MLEMLKRWLPAQESFRVMQRCIPLSCGDISMCLRLGGVGVDVEFEKNICGVVGSVMKDKLLTVENVINVIKSLLEAEFVDVDNVCRLYILVCFAVLYFPRNSRTICNIPFSVLDNIDRLSTYNWGKAVHTYLVKSLSRAFLALGQTEICLSGSTTVLQLWAVERLRLCASDAEIVFPRILGWTDFQLKRRRVEKLFQETHVICSFRFFLEWRLREEDHENEIIREALQLGHEGQSKKAHVDNKVASMQDLLKKLRKHGRRLRKLKKHMTELHEEILSRSHVGDEEDGENVDENGAEGVHKEADVEVEVEQRDQEDEIGEHLHKCFDLNSESDVAQFGEVLALQAIAPYDPQQPSFDSLGVDLMKLYNTVTYDRTPYRLVANINGQILGTSECCGFGPTNKVDNMAVLFGASTMMYFERRKYGHVKRVAFNPLYATHVLNDSRRMKINRRQWTLKDYEVYFRAGLISVKDIVDADFLFAPTVHEGHWWCYAVNCQQKKLYVLDSIGHSNKNRKRLDNAIMSAFVHAILDCSRCARLQFGERCYPVSHDQLRLSPVSLQNGILKRHD
ncbi:uncharacterized protein LOC114180443 [Vigna unguiculata]|uniref:uncharacterized protein LOC114180443 n=1 Tax=Vigna unguiculata TaxID=3917 RepID=UPI001016FB0E|nr:uncharacterized protein LOC114180443 [Vigna unguiculata]